MDGLQPAALGRDRQTVKWLAVLTRLSAKRARRRRLLGACRWWSREINIRGHVRGIETMIDRGKAQR
jgi:hypothetical protein